MKYKKKNSKFYLQVPYKTIIKKIYKMIPNNI